MQEIPNLDSLRTLHDICKDDPVIAQEAMRLA